MTSFDLGFEDLDLEPVSATNNQKFGVVCLPARNDSASWYMNQVSFLNASTWNAEMPEEDEASIGRWVEAAAAHLRAAGDRPVNVIASGETALGAILLAAAHPELMTSLILGDPEMDVTSELFTRAVERIRTPTLVIAATPEKDTDISIPQGIAGGIDNGVFVIIDDCAVPAHHNKHDSFNEWTSSFIRIAEGLHTFGQSQEENNV
jgi:pimeloyl-ACP methyl ester carboxylesterase